MRSFIAIDIPEALREELVFCQQQIKGAQCSYPKEFHITLKFLGEVPENRIEEISLRLREISAAGFEASLSHIGAFPNERQTRVVWIGAEPADRIVALQREVDAALQGLFPKERDFKPHITLARVKRIADREHFLNSLGEVQGRALTFTVDSVKLKKSTLTAQGPVYEDLAECTLKAGHSK